LHVGHESELTAPSISAVYVRGPGSDFFFPRYN
jgi:hypothetical protein